MKNFMFFCFFAFFAFVSACSSYALNAKQDNMSLQAEGYGSPEEIENLYRVARDERLGHHGLDKGKDVALMDPRTGQVTVEAKEPYQNGYVDQYYGQYNSSTYGYGYGQGVYLPSGYEIDPVRVAAGIYAERQAERPRQQTSRSRPQRRPQYEATETYEDDSEVVYYDDEQEAPSPKRSRKKAKSSARSAVDQARLKKVEQRVDSLEKDSATTKDMLNSHLDE